MANPHTFEDSFRVHDLAVMKWLEACRVDYGTVGTATRNNVPILAVFASPDRAFAQVADLLVRTGWIDGSTVADARENAALWPEVLPLPILSVQRQEPVPDPELANPGNGFPRFTFDEVTGEWVNHPWPQHFSCDYTINLWCAKQYTRVYFAEWMLSNFGKTGMAHNETLIPVVHNPPWGLMLQRVRYQGSSDLSDLEGEDIRYQRVEYTISLRMWVMRKPDRKAHIIHTVGVDTEQATCAESVPLDIFAGDAVQSANLWAIPWAAEQVPTEWPKTGNATVAVATKAPGACRRYANGLSMSLTGDADSVELLERLVPLWTSGRGVVSFAFQYQSDGAVEVEGWQRSANEAEYASVFSRTLPATRTWKWVQLFVYVSEPYVMIQVRGLLGRPLTRITLVNPDFRVVAEQPAVTAAAVDGGDVDLYTFTGLSRRPYLMTARVVSTVGGPNIVSFRNDPAAPSDSQDMGVDSSVHAGLAAVSTPVTASMVVRVPKSVVLASVSLQPYDGHHYGNEA